FKEILGRHFIRHVDVALLEQRAAIAGGRYLALDHTLDLRHWPALPIVVARVHDFLARLPRFDLVGTATGGVGLGPGEAPGIFGRYMLFYQFGIEDGRHRYRHVYHRQLVLTQEVHLEGVVVNHDELFWFF